ncbi:MAG: terminase small subunit [Isosphaeraceae bacterium]
MSKPDKTPAPERELTHRERLFVTAFLGEANGVAVEAARIAGYSSPGKVAHRLVGRSGISAAIAQATTAAALSANQILAHLSELATANLLSFLKVEPDGSCKVDVAAAQAEGRGFPIRSLRLKDGAIEITLEARLPALRQIGEYHGLWRAEKPPSEAIDAVVEALNDADRIPGGLEPGTASGAP